MSASDLMDQVRRLGAPMGSSGRSRSSPGRCWRTASSSALHRSALGESAADKLLANGQRALGVPQGFRRRDHGRAQADADIIHFGYEGGVGQPTHKIYLEFASRLRRARALNAGDPVLVHLAFKWTPGVPGQRAETRYTWVPCRSEGAIAERLRRLVPPGEAPRALRCGLELVARARQTDRIRAISS